MNCASESCVTNPEWKWNNSTYDYDIYAHAVDQNGSKDGDGTPYQYSTDVSDWSKSGSQYWANPSSIPRCALAPNTVSGELSFSTQNPSTDKACVANTHNAGNWYNYPAATAGSDNHSVTTNTEILNSICPKGWRLPPNAGNKSYNTLIRTAYGISDTASDTNLLNNTAMSFVRLGYYSHDCGSLVNRGNYGRYWSSTAYSTTSSHYLVFYSGNLSPQGSILRAVGFSIRCVSR